MNVGQKCILITGAASGIGRATAELFAERGWFVGAFDIDEAALASLQGELGEGVFARLDVSDSNAIGRATNDAG